jgi:hypothetical protein
MARSFPAFAFLVVAALAACGRAPQDVPSPRPAAAGDSDLSNLSARLIAFHNRERAAVGAPALAWDRGLAEGAAAYARELGGRGKLAHASREARGGAGENLWMGTRGGYSVEDMAGSWAAEKAWFRAGLFPDVTTKSRRWDEVAHYTQMIWRATQRVGCAVHRAREWDYLVCRYAPAGNVVGQRVP